ncbi:aminopeptidase P family protein, partial [Enterococcus faecalis]|nr:aminopeptidase P family protein [Enterococcus faecalis]
MNQEKIADLKNWMHQEKIDFTYISDPGHIAYFSGYESEPHERVLALFIAADDQSFLFTPALEVEDAEKSSWTYPVYGYLDSENPWEKIAALLNKRTQGTPRFALEKQALSLARFDQLKTYFPASDFSHDVTPLIEKLQLIKTEPEIQRLLEAGSWADVAFEIGFKAIQAGVAEQEIVAEIEYQLKRQGIRSMSFDTLVLTGKNGASPHGVPGETKIEPHDLVLFDLGVVHNGY